MIIYLIYSIAAIFVAWIWVDYYRLVDIYEKNKLQTFLPPFILGALFTSVVFALELWVFEPLGWEINDDILNDALISIFKIGLVEEIAKILPYLVVVLLFKKKFEEPLDHLAFICTSALGFAAVENFGYLVQEGSTVLTRRAVLTTVSHMTDSALVAYGFIRWKYHPTKKSVWQIPAFLLFAAVSHGFYDFWLLHRPFAQWGFIFTVIYFLVTLSFFATIINNAANNSPHFSYKQVVHTSKITRRLMYYYLIVFLLEFGITCYTEDFYTAFAFSQFNIFTSGPILLIICVRLARFTLIKNRWNPIKFQFPFEVSVIPIPGYAASSRARIHIRGETFNEMSLSQFYHSYFYLFPVSSRNTGLGGGRLAYVEKKLFLGDDISFYLIRIFTDQEDGPFIRVLIRSKTWGKITTEKGSPIVGILTTDEPLEGEVSNIQMDNMYFAEWVYLKPMAPDETHEPQALETLPFEEENAPIPINEKPGRVGDYR